eukprot:snap_masked-scaffold_6-processed-gene-1.29-mRNA-1 protein AED:0.27 eAED:0.27 QI:0/-1/0/1/-1/1/1/0/1172
MGVPKFYRWLSERYPLINRKIGTDPTQLPTFDCLYLDLNGIIHTSSHNNSSENLHISFDQICENIFKLVNELVHVVQPREYLYLAIDGSAPRAKMNQQRSRRFASARDRFESVKKCFPQKTLTEQIMEFQKQFDSNCITPGTEFMTKLDGKFKEFVKEKCKKDIIWKRCKVFFSGHQVPAEGEHAIMEFIRESSGIFSRRTYHHVCNSLDADLIMLGLATGEERFSLLREEVDFTGGRGEKEDRKKRERSDLSSWEILDLNILRKYLEIEFNKENLERIMFEMDVEEPDQELEFEIERVIIDLVVLFMLIGNDFLPHLNGVDIKFGALDQLILFYKQVLIENRSFLVNKDEQMIDFSVLCAILVKAEAEMGPEKSSKLSDEDVEIAAKEFLRGMFWCFKYYFFGVPSWNWFYPFHYPPTISSLVNLLKTTDFVELAALAEFNLGQPFLPFTQLTCCLPPISANLLPNSYSELMLSENSPIKDFYPWTFKVDMNGKRNSWEGINLIPFIDISRLEKAIEENVGILNNDENNRNSFGKVLVIESSEKIEYKDEDWTEWDYFWKQLIKRNKSELRKVGVNIFGRASQKESFVLVLKNFGKMKTGSQKSIGFPHKEFNSKSTWTVKKVLNRTNSKEEELIQLAEHDLMYGNGKPGGGFGGVEVDDKMKYILLEQEGRFGVIREKVVPISCLISPNLNVINTFAEPKDGSLAINLSQRTLGDILKFDEKKKHWIKFRSFTSIDKFFGSKLHQNVRDRYYSGNQLARSFGISPETFGKLTGSLLISLGKKSSKLLFPDQGYQKVSRMNIGLSLKSSLVDEETREKIFYKLPGFSERIKKGWFYTDKTKTLVSEYIKLFPHVVHSLENCESNFIYSEEDLNLDLNDLVKLKDILGKVKSQTGRLVEEKSEYLCDKAKKMLIKNVAQIFSLSKFSTEKVDHGIALREEIAKFSKNFNIAGKKEVYVGDFVLNINERSGLISFGKPGIVIGWYQIQKEIDVEVLFEGETSALTVSIDSLLNLTRGQGFNKKTDKLVFLGEDKMLAGKFESRKNNTKSVWSKEKQKQNQLEKKPKKPLQKLKVEMPAKQELNQDEEIVTPKPKKQWKKVEVKKKTTPSFLRPAQVRRKKKPTLAEAAKNLPKPPLTPKKVFRCEDLEQQMFETKDDLKEKTNVLLAKLNLNR